MTISTEQATPEVHEDPEALVYMHHPETKGVKAIKRRQFRLYDKKGWVLGDGGIYADLDEVPATAAPVVHIDRDGTLVTPYAEAAPEVADAPAAAPAATPKVEAPKADVAAPASAKK